jgi:hypothetical protein
MGEYQKRKLVLIGTIISGILIVLTVISQSDEVYFYYGEVTEVIQCDYLCRVKGEIENGKEILIRIDTPSSYVGEKFSIGCYKDSDHNNRERCNVAEPFY